MAKRNAGSRSRKTAARRSSSRRAVSARARSRGRKTGAKPAASSRSRATRKPAVRAVKKVARKKTARPAARHSTAASSRSTQAAKRPATKSARPTPAALQRERRRLDEDTSPLSLPSTLNFDRKASSASSGRDALRQQRRLHTEAGPALTGGDIDADWEDGYSEGDEAPGGDNPTPDQDVVEEIGRALGVEYDDGEELKGADKISERDTNRWEYDPASAEDYRERNKKQ
jgi:hypothetical protein